MVFFCRSFSLMIRLARKTARRTFRHFNTGSVDVLAPNVTNETMGMFGSRQLPFRWAQWIINQISEEVNNSWYCNLHDPSNRKWTTNSFLRVFVGSTKTVGNWFGWLTWWYRMYEKSIRPKGSDKVRTNQLQLLRNTPAVPSSTHRRDSTTSIMLFSVL